MAEKTDKRANRGIRIRHRGWVAQIPIYLGKQLRSFINLSDWKVLPMAAIISGLVSMVIRRRFFVTMEGSLMGAFALTCVALWNGCFNSIQVVCRERPIVKREHRSGMHISSYMISHMLYQFFLCLLQTIVSLYVMRLVGVKIPVKGFITRFMIVDIGFTMLLIAYASDMMSLLISSIAHTTTGAMTIMPFVLIFQLVFAGTIIPLPEWSRPLSNYTISSYGIKAIASQSGYNELPMDTGWNTLNNMRNSDIDVHVTVGQALDLLDSPAVQNRRDIKVMDQELLSEVASSLGFGDAAQIILTIKKDSIPTITVGMITDFLKNSETLKAKRDTAFDFKLSINDLFDLFGEENVKKVVMERTAAAAQRPEYERSYVNILNYWFMLMVFAAVFAALSILVMEMIDHDKR